MRFDLVGLQLFLHVTEAASITHGARGPISRLPPRVAESAKWRRSVSFRCYNVAATVSRLGALAGHTSIMLPSATEGTVLKKWSSSRRMYPRSAVVKAVDRSIIFMTGL